MIIAHLPAGYLLGHWLDTRLPATLVSRNLMRCSLAGSIFPDVDLLYFYLLDARQHHHHSYWTHLPIAWLTVTALVLIALWRRGHLPALGCAIAFLANVWLHLLLDSWAGDIWWLYPWLDRPFALFQVLATEGFWLWSFVRHWTFVPELLLLLTAFHVWRGQLLRDSR